MECLPKEEIVQGSIVITPFPFLDKPESKVRPALVISNSRFNSATDNLIVVPITSSMKDTPYSAVISKEDIAEGGLLVTSRIRVDMSEIAFSARLGASAQGRLAISEHAQKHAPGFSPECF